MQKASFCKIQSLHFVMTVTLFRSKSENRSEIPGVVHDMSGSGATVFIEPLAVVELNNNIRELEIAERDEIYKILLELTMRVKELSPI